MAVEVEALAGGEVSLRTRGSPCRVSRPPSLTSLFSTLHGIWKMRHIKQRQKGPIRLSDNEDIEQGREQHGDVDVEAGGLSSSVFSLRDRQKMKQVGVDVNSMALMNPRRMRIRSPRERR